LIIGGLLVIGISATLLFGPTGQSASGPGGEVAQFQNEMTVKYGDQWRELGIADWQYTGVEEVFFFYVDSQSWTSFSIDDQKKRMNEAGKDYIESVSANGGDSKKAYVMFHDSVNRNIMIGTYTAADGAQIQQ